MVALLIVLFIIILVLAISCIIIYLQYKKNKSYYEIVNSNLDSMGIVQKMFELTTSTITADEKIIDLNNTIINSYNFEYSTISLFDGNSYEIRATNIKEDFYKESLANLAQENEFKTNVGKNISKYLTTNATKTLSYKTAVERNIKSVMFSPIYNGGTYLGFWILEDERENAFDNISKDELSRIKANLGIFIENVNYQKTLEIAENTDKQTGFYNNMYLYSNTRNELAKNENSSLTLIYLKNLPEINEKYGRNIGNALIIKISNALKDTLSSDSIFVRYSGIRLLVITPGTNAEVLHPTIERSLSRMKNEAEYVGDEKVSVELQVLMHTFKKQNNVEKEIQKMMTYMDGMESANTIKII